MGAFLALVWDRDAPEAAREGERVSARVGASGGWTLVHRGRSTRVWARGPGRMPVRGDERVLVIGACLARARTHPYALPDLAPATPPHALAERLCDEAWGAYVALLGERAVFRDPSGALDGLTWSLGPVRVITSDAGSPPADLRPARCALDWRVIGAWLQDSSRGAVQSGLSGVEVVGPGAILDWCEDPPRQRLVWRPSRFIGAGRVAGRDTGEAVRSAVGLAVDGLAQGHERLLLEISGGLDSAVVAAAAIERGLAPRVAGALNYYGDRPEGDERGYASAIADHLGLSLQCVAKPVAPLTAADFASAAQGVRPGFATVDPVRDRDTAGRLRTAGATGLVTGHGGDVVFFQMPTLAIAADRRREAGLRGLSGAFVADVARLTRRPAWAVLKAAFAADAASAYRPPSLAAAGRGTRPWTDPWTADCAAAPPGKRLQVRALHRAQLAMGWSQRGLVADVLHPLLSQPVMELSLGLTTTELTRGGRDRVVAREAYRGRLPDRVIDRRAKGDLTAHYGRVIAASLDLLRPLLLDGCLADAGLLDRRRLEAILTPEQLVLERANSEILVAALIESWVRWWQARVPDAPEAPRRA